MESTTNVGTSQHSPRLVRLLHVPDSVLVLVFSYLRPAAVAKCARVCSAWNTVFNDPSTGILIEHKRLKKLHEMRFEQHSKLAEILMQWLSLGNEIASLERTLTEIGDANTVLPDLHRLLRERARAPTDVPSDLINDLGNGDMIYAYLRRDHGSLRTTKQFRRLDLIFELSVCQQLRTFEVAHHMSLYKDWLRNRNLDNCSVENASASASTSTTDAANEGMTPFTANGQFCQLALLDNVLDEYNAFMKNSDATFTRMTTATMLNDTRAIFKRYRGPHVCFNETQETQHITRNYEPFEGASKSAYNCNNLFGMFSAFTAEQLQRQRMDAIYFFLTRTDFFQRVLARNKERVRSVPPPRHLCDRYVQQYQPYVDYRSQTRLDHKIAAFVSNMRAQPDVVTEADVLAHIIGSEDARLDINDLYIQLSDVNMQTVNQSHMATNNKFTNSMDGMIKKLRQKASEASSTGGDALSANEAALLKLLSQLVALERRQRNLIRRMIPLFSTDYKNIGQSRVVMVEIGYVHIDSDVPIDNSGSAEQAQSHFQHQQHVTCSKFVTMTTCFVIYNCNHIVLLGDCSDPIAAQGALSPFRAYQQYWLDQVKDFNVRSSASIDPKEPLVQLCKAYFGPRIAFVFKPEQESNRYQGFTRGRFKHFFK